MLVELGLVEQRYQAVLEVLNDGATVTEVARRYGVARQTVHVWLRRYAGAGLAGLADKSSRPVSCPHQMPPEVEARIVEMRREHPGWGPRTIGHWLARRGVEPGAGAHVDGAMSDPPRAGHPAGPAAAPGGLQALGAVPGDGVVADGHRGRGAPGRTGRRPRSCRGSMTTPGSAVSRLVVARATARPTCDALALAMRRYGVPEQILTDNGKVFTGRFGPGTGEVLFDRICRENGISHLLTAPRSPTTTGKVERWHRRCGPSSSPARCSTRSTTPRPSSTGGCDELQPRPAASGRSGWSPPWERFRLATVEPGPAADTRHR